MRSTYIAWALVIVAAFGAIAIFVPEGIGAAIMLVGLCLILVPVLRNYSSEPDLITKVFFAGLVLRALFGLIVYANGWFDFFGADALTYDWRGSLIADY